MDIHDTGPPDLERRFRDLFASTYVDLLRFVERRVHPSHAEDIVADAYLVAWRRLAEVPTDHDDARAWLVGVARRTVMSGVRGEQRRAALAVRVAEADATSAAVIDADLVVRRLDLARAWKQLSAVHQEALALAIWDGLDSPRAAAVLGISPVAYRLRLSRGRRALRAFAERLPTADPATSVVPSTRSTP
ncbi:MAG: polymerase, sigma subunit, family [Nocardioides sp.]|nr:polymerase, sigma subunit, family [Nocardioides sp.]